MTLRVLALALVIVLAAAGAAVAPPRVPVAAESTPPAHLFLPHVTSVHCGRVFETFDGPTTDWFTGQSNGLLAEIHDGEYRLFFTGPGAVWLVPAPVCPRTEYHAAVDAHWAGAPGNFIGLLFGIDEAGGRNYLLAVNTDDRVWLVFEVRGNSLDMIIEPVGHDAVLPGNAVNRLAAVRQGDTIHLSINGTAVGELHDANPGPPVLAGVAAASYTTQSTADARFDHFLWARE